MITPWKENYDQPRQHSKNQRHYFANKGLSSQGYGFSSGHVWMWELNYKESWAQKNGCFWTVELEKTLESSLDYKEIQPVHPKVDQSWVFIGKTDVKDESLILWPPDAKSWLIVKDPDAGKDWRREEKGTTEDEMFGCPHQLNGHESWTIKKAEHRRIDSFELWCWRRLLRVPWTTRRSNQSILKEISSEYSLEGLMLKLKLHYFGCLFRRTDSLEKTLMLEAGEGDDREWNGWMASPTQCTWVWVNLGSWWWTGRPGVLQSMGVAKSPTLLSNWTELNKWNYSMSKICCKLIQCQRI